MKWNGKEFNKNDGNECILFFDVQANKFLWIRSSKVANLLDTKKYLVNSESANEFPKFYSFELDKKKIYDNVDKNGFVTI